MKMILITGRPGSGKLKWAREYRDEANVVALKRDPFPYQEPIQGRDWTKETPFRAPHHTVSLKSMMGCMREHRWMPGEISLAQWGVLYLDDVTDFAGNVLEDLGEACVQGYKELRSVDGVNRLQVPVDFTLIATTGYCPCDLGLEECKCTKDQKARHRARLPQWLRVGADEVKL